MVGAFLIVFLASWFVLCVIGAYFADREAMKTDKQYGRVFLTATSLMALVISVIFILW